MNPEYFKTQLTWNEAILFIRGIERRYRAAYVAARSTNVLVGGLFAKNYKPVTFSWEKEAMASRYAPPSEEEMEEIRRNLNITTDNA